MSLNFPEKGSLQLRNSHKKQMRCHICPSTLKYKTVELESCYNDHKQMIVISDYSAD